MFRLLLNNKLINNKSASLQIFTRNNQKCGSFKREFTNIPINNNNNFGKIFAEEKNNKQNTLKNQLELIQKNSKEPLLFFNLFKLMKLNEKKEITLLSGDKLTTKEILVKEIRNNPYNKDGYIHLILNSNPTDLFELPTYISKTKQSTTMPTITKYNNIQLLLIILDIDERCPFSLNRITELLVKNNCEAIKLINGETMLLSELSIRNYLINKNFLPNSYFLMIEALNPKKSVQFNDGAKITIETILVEGLNKFPEFSNFYHYLAKPLTNNQQTIKISSDLKMNRIELYKKAIETIYKYKSNPPIHPLYKNEQHLLPLFYFNIAEYLETIDDIIVINGIEFNKFSLYIKSIDYNNYMFLPKISLVKIMKPNQQLLIKSMGNQPISRIDILNSIIKEVKDNNKPDSNHTKLSSCYSLLSRIYNQENQIEKSNYYQEILQKEIELNRNSLINIINKTPQFAQVYITLASTLINKDKNKKLLIGGQTMSKSDLLLKSIDLKPDLKIQYYELSQLLKTEGDDKSNTTIKLLNGTILTKKELLEKELKNSSDVKTMFLYYYECDNKFSKSNDNNNDLITIKLKHIDRAISLDSKFPLPYLEIGLILHHNKLNKLDELYSDSNLPNYFKLSRKELFKKYLELSYPIYPMITTDINNNNDLLAWRHLSKEMNNNETQYGKTKLEILNETYDYEELNK